MSIPNAPATPDRRDQQAADRRASDQADLEAERVERAGGGQLLPVDEARRQRVERRPQEAAEAGRERLDDEEHPDLRARQQGVHEQHGRAQRHPELRDPHHPPPVDRVRERTADDRRQEQRHERDEREQADHGRRAGQVVDLVRDGDERDLRAEERDGEPEPEQAVLAVPAERAEVDRREADEPARAALRDGRRRTEALGLVELLLVGHG